jgi:copper homeostasis protein
MKIEICANSLTSAINAEAGGADRIELCSELSLGGITPSSGLIELVRERLSIDFFVLIRPRAGDFCYSEDELNVIRKDILFCKKMGCDGVVVGVLNENATINITVMQELIALARPMKVTFHRAFDVCRAPLEALDELIELGVDRILTSGQQPTAVEGIMLLKELLIRSNQRIIILAGSGVNLQNVEKLHDIGIQEVHFSAKKALSYSILEMNNSVKLEEIPYQYWESNKDTIKKMTELIQKIKNDKR